MADTWKTGDYTLLVTTCETCPSQLRLTRDIDLDSAEVLSVRIQQDPGTGKRILVLL